MNARQTLAMVLIAAAAAAGAFAATRAARAPRVVSGSPTTAPAGSTDPTQVLMDWLGVAQANRQQLATYDQDFSADLQKLRDDLAARRLALANALQDPKSPDELISARVEEVIAAGSALQRRITRYLLAVRHDLTAAQQQKLFELCAENVRQAGGLRWRGGRGDSQDMGPGRGPGMGRGRGYRGGR